MTVQNALIDMHVNMLINILHVYTAIKRKITHGNNFI